MMKKDNSPFLEDTLSSEIDRLRSRINGSGKIVEFLAIGGIGYLFYKTGELERDYIVKVEDIMKIDSDMALLGKDKERTMKSSEKKDMVVLVPRLVKSDGLKLYDGNNDASAYLPIGSAVIGMIAAYVGLRAIKNYIPKLYD